jgi:TolA-binding protein
MKSAFRKVVPFLLLSVALSAVAAPSMAGTWQQNHPRRAQVNSRLNNQNKRIHNEVKDGQISKSQAASLHHEDHQVRQEERDMASQNGGHITKQEQATLNSQENGISKQIGH